MELNDFENAELRRAEREKLGYDQVRIAREMSSGCNQKAQAIGMGITGQISRPSLREEAEQQVGFHREQADKQDRAAAFFREHPEFDEFIQLIRGGVIGI
jgi:hypothetical protein